MITNILLLTITAYYNPHHTIDASGHCPLASITCAASRTIPLGTKLYVEGIGERIVTDRTAKRFDGRVDIFMDSKIECIKFGKQQRKVWIYITNKQ